MPERRPPRPTDGFSLAALVAGVVGTGPVAFALGAVGLHRTGRGATSGRGFAIAGIVLGGLQMLAASAAVALLVGFAATGASPTAWLPGSGTGAVAVDDLERGDCFAAGADAGASGTVDRTDCSAHHDGEVLEVVDLPDGDYPGVLSLEGFAEDRCSADATAALETAGLDPEDFEFGYFYPLEQDWAGGSRYLQCTVHGWQADLRGSVLGGDAVLTP